MGGFTLISVNFTRYENASAMAQQHRAFRLTRLELTNRSDRIRSKLTEVFAPSVLDVKDDSSKHAGHAGARPEGETHYTVTIVSSQFEGQSRVTIQRAINKALASEFDCGLHALQIKASAAKP